MNKTCESCGYGLLIARADARFCSTACRMKAYRKRKREAAAPDPIPEEMRRQDRWMRWERVNRRGKVSKRPVAVSGRPGSSTTADTWTDYAAATASTIGAGVGFALGDGIGCIDLDGAVDESGAVLPWAQLILDAAPETFVELSQSRRGLHVFGFLPEGRGRNVHRGDEGVEVYSTGRFIAMTGERFGDAPSSLADLSELTARIT